MSYGEWLVLLGGIMEDTPLGQTVLIRKEDDRERLKSFTPHQHRIRNEWREFRAGQKREVKAPQEFAAEFEKIFADMFGEKR